MENKIEGVIIKPLKKYQMKEDVYTICLDVMTQFLKSLEKYISQ